MAEEFEGPPCPLDPDHTSSPQLTPTTTDATTNGVNAAKKQQYAAHSEARLQEDNITSEATTHARPKVWYIL